jgi:hypothetical protein
MGAVIGDGFHFTSPVDSRLDRGTCFDKCWKNSETITDFAFINLVGDGERFFATYEEQSTTGERFRNTEIVRRRLSGMPKSAVEPVVELLRLRTPGPTITLCRL